MEMSLLTCRQGCDLPSSFCFYPSVTQLLSAQLRYPNSRTIAIYVAMCLVANPGRGLLPESDNKPSFVIMCSPHTSSNTHCALLVMHVVHRRRLACTFSSTAHLGAPSSNAVRIKTREGELIMWAKTRTRKNTSAATIECYTIDWNSEKKWPKNLHLAD
jgi:hypothetical protein